MAEDYNTLSATDEDVLSPYTFIGASKEKSSGGMKNNGSTKALIKCGEEFVIPLGYHDGTGIVRVSTLGDQTDDANVTPGRMLKGKTAWVNGVMVTGEIENIEDAYSTDNITYVNGIFSAHINSGAYLMGSNSVYTSGARIASVIGLTADMIATGSISFGISGSFDSTGTITEADVLKGKTAYSKGKKIVGTLVLPSLY